MFPQLLIWTWNRLCKSVVGVLNPAPLEFEDREKDQIEYWEKAIYRYLWIWADLHWLLPSLQWHPLAMKKMQKNCFYFQNCYYLFLIIYPWRFIIINFKKFHLRRSFHRFHHFSFIFKEFIKNSLLLTVIAVKCLIMLEIMRKNYFFCY